MSECMGIEVYGAEMALRPANASCSTDRLLLWSIRVFACIRNDAVALLRRVTHPPRGHLLKVKHNLLTYGDN